MADFDLSLINNKRKTLTLHGEEVTFKILTLEQHFNAEFDANDIDNFHIETREDIKVLAGMVARYVVKILNITVAESKKVTISEYRNLRKYMSRLDMYEQGFTDAEIDDLEKKAAFRAISEAVTTK